MTNNWTDLGNATLFIVMGANPAENHPASIAHINRARTAPGHVLPGGQTSNKPAAELIVVDPRKTRTAAIADKFIRIRPGTDIAFINGVIKYMIDNISGDKKTNWEAWLNYQDAARSFQADDNTATTCSGSKYTDARFILTAISGAADYKRSVQSFGGKLISNLPERAASYNASGVNTVFNALEAHVAPYTAAVAADICGCDAADIAYVGDKIIANSRCASYNPTAPTTIVGDPTSQYYRSTTFMYAMGLTQHTCGSQNVKSFATIQLLMGNTGRAGGGINALRGIHNVQGSTDMGLLYHLIPGYSANPTTGSTFGPYMDKLYGYRLSNAKYAGLIQGSAAANSDLYFAAKATGVAGNAITVELADPAPLTGQAFSVAYSAPSGITVNLANDGAGVLTTTALDVKNGLSANTLVNVGVEGDGSGLVTAGSGALAGGADATYDDAYLDPWTKGFLQAPGFHNMTRAFFSGDRSTSYSKTQIDALYSCWPKTNGRNHIGMFRDMEHGTVKGAVVWGQNPAVTEPNQSAVRDGLYNLDTLVCTDMFYNETAAANRKPSGTTYLFPACSHVEEAGSATNSGRVLQWRYQAIPPKGDSKTDQELLLRFAKALDGAGAFSHIKAACTGVGIWASGDAAWDKLYGTPYGWTWGTDFNTAPSLTGGDYVTQVSGTSVENTSATLTGCEAVSERVYRELCTNVGLAPTGGGGGTMWLYTNGYAATGNSATQYPSALTGVVWTVKNRSKSRKNDDPWGTLAHPRWGFAWLINRRVLYNNGDIHIAGTTTASDQADGYQGPDQCGRFFVSTNSGLIDYGRSYRHIHTLADMPKIAGGTTPTIHKTPGRFPSHTEPYETPRDGTGDDTNLVTTWGKNSRNTAYQDCLPTSGTGYFTDTPIGTAAGYPLVLTTIRCVEHFQGGPITRNNPANFEVEPEPWIEINSVDARNYGISDGDMVKVTTARADSDAGTGNLVVPPTSPGGFGGQGFRARVGVGIESNQRTGVGVVAIPWHWGDVGLSTGSRANDLCIDANDANTTIPEYKACLCKIEKM